MRRGVALMMVAGVLALLVTLATAFVTLAQHQRRASVHRIQGVKAHLLACAGLENAIARLAQGQDPGRGDVAYAGEDWDASGGGLSAFESAQEVWHPGIPDTEDCPVTQALRPSFFVRQEATGLPRTVAVQDRQRGYSGTLPGVGTYALKVEDESAKLNVNGGFLDEGDRDGDGVPDHRDPDVRLNPGNPKDTGRGWNFQLARVLDVLGQQAEVGVAGLGTLVLQARPPGGYRSIAALQAALGTSKDLSDWLTCSGWVDRSVVHPHGFESQPPAVSLSDVKKGRAALVLEEGGRPPVNLNAASGAVLRALLSGLSGRSWHHPLYPQTYTLDAAVADGIAQAMLQSRPFRSRGHFGAFVDGLIPSVINGYHMAPAVPTVEGDDLVFCGGGNLAAADLVKANFDPNSMLNKHLPDQLMWRWVDKSDLVTWSTEGSLGSTGAFRVFCVGRVAGAESVVEAMVEAFTVLSQSTQQDFLGGREPDDGAQSCLSLCGDPLARTTGASAAWRHWGGGAGRGLAVATYPCQPGAAAAQAAECDGAIGLATVEMSPTPAAGMTLLFLHHFDDGWDADGGAEPARKPGGPNDANLQADPAAPVWPPPAQEPGTLYPDGMHAQQGRAPAYQAQGNLPEGVPITGVSGQFTNRGVISYWCKPVADVLPWSDYSKGTPVEVSVVRGHTVPGGSGPYFLSQAWLVGRQNAMVGFLGESIASFSDAQHERMYFRIAQGGSRLPGARWRLTTAWWDTSPGSQVALYCQGLMPMAGQMNAGYATPLDPLLGDDLTADTGIRLVLGGQKTDMVVGVTTPLYANQIVDEFAVCDFGVGALPAVEAWASVRYKEGRYYKGEPGGSQGAFLSVPLGSGGPLRVLKASWTAYLPSESRLELVASSVLPASGTPRLVDPQMVESGSGSPRLWIEVDLMGVDGTLDGAPLVRMAQDAPVQQILPGFRYRVRFRNGHPYPMDAPVLETPFFDDIRFMVQPPGWPRLTAWRSGPPG